MNRRRREKRQEEGKEGELTFLAPKCRTIHSLTHSPQHKPNRILHLDIIFILLLQQTLGSTVIGAYAGCFPAGVVPAGVGLVKLEVLVGIVAGVEEGYTKGTETCVVSVSEPALEEKRNDVM